MPAHRKTPKPPPIPLPDPETQPWAGIDEACDNGWLPFARNAAYEAVKRGDIPFVRVGGKIAIPIAALRRLAGLDA